MFWFLFQDDSEFTVFTLTRWVFLQLEIPSIFTGPWDHEVIEGFFYPEKNGGDKESDTISLRNQITQLSQLIQTAKQGSMTSIPWKCQLQKKRNRSAWILLKSPKKSQETSWAVVAAKRNTI